MINLLVITTLYPNRNQFRHGIFVENRIKNLVKTERVSALVMAPVPWCPAFVLWLWNMLGLSRWMSVSHYEEYQHIPKEEYRFGIRVLHPRYLVIPKIGMYLTPLFLAISLFLNITRLRRSGESWDMVDSHYFYPDGVAVALVSHWLKSPFTITARGSDINLISDYWLARKMMLWAAEKASMNLCVSGDLNRKMITLGMKPEKVMTVTNGIDESIFVARNEQERAALREQLGLSQYTVAAVGNLIELKGQHLLIEALKSLPDITLLLVGEGEARDSLEAQVSSANLKDRVRFLGNVQQPQLVDIYNAVDLVCLASSREGCANVLLEAIACGTPVLATDVGGNPETINSSELGKLTPDRTADSFIACIKNLQETTFDRDRIRALSKRFWYNSINESLIQVYQSVTSPAQDTANSKSSEAHHPKKWGASQK
ncbi:glycosyltransferase family 4 protein [Pseudomaricurvus sp.]|uniref:glycosyltransferase family 4 protein n=1 Tax=Pseudomaricurvus sp. TaxID=2004510 RepID=UPI003F6C490E